ncbi:MAG TPA: hypothetical protein PKD85_00610 [Saprospiraceae bacterium]|nr:hypothetical protein [Saprospiraceae bacterium]
MDSLQVKAFMAAVNPDVKRDIFKKMCITKFDSLSYDEEDNDWYVWVTEYYSHFSKKDQTREIITDLFLFINTESNQDFNGQSENYQNLFESKTLPACSCSIDKDDPSYGNIFIRERWTSEKVIDHFIQTGKYHGGDLGEWKNIKLSQTIAEMKKEEEELDKSE